MSPHLLAIRKSKLRSLNWVPGTIFLGAANCKHFLKALDDRKTDNLGNAGKHSNASSTDCCLHAATATYSKMLARIGPPKSRWCQAPHSARLPGKLAKTVLLIGLIQSSNSRCLLAICEAKLERPGSRARHHYWHLRFASFLGSLWVPSEEIKSLRIRSLL